MVKNPPANAGDVGLILGLGRSPGEGNGNPFQYFCLIKEGLDPTGEGNIPDGSTCIIEDKCMVLYVPGGCLPSIPPQ